jgi:hypothetical protein
MNYEQKYLKYKAKYLELKGGNETGYTKKELDAKKNRRFIY